MFVVVHVWWRIVGRRWSTCEWISTERQLQKHQSHDNLATYTPTFGLFLDSSFFPVFQTAGHTVDFNSFHTTTNPFIYRIRGLVTKCAI